MSTAPAVNGTVSTANKSRGQLKRLKKKAKAATVSEEVPAEPVSDLVPPKTLHHAWRLISTRALVSQAPAASPVPKVEEVEHDITSQAEYVVEQLEVPADFANVFAHFQAPPPEDEVSFCVGSSC